MKDIDLKDVGATEIVIKEQSFYTSTVEFTIPILQSADQPLVKGEEVRVWLDGHVVLIGPVTTCDPALDAAGDQAWSVVVSDRWHWLETCSYITELRKYGETSGSGLLVPMAIPGGRFVMVDPGVYAPKPNGEGTEEEPLTPTIAIGAAFSDIVANSAHLRSRLVLDFEHEQEMIPFETSLSYLAELMRAVQQWRPGLTTRFDYADPDDPALIITDRGEVVSLDAEVDDLRVVNLVSRPDLVPPAVGVIGVAATGNQSIAYTMASYPPDATDRFKDPGALLLSVSLPAGTKTAPSRGALPNMLIGMTPEEAAELLGIPVIKTTAETATSVLPHVGTMIKDNAARVILRGDKFPTEPEDWAKWWYDKSPQLFGGLPLSRIKTTRPPTKGPTTPDAIYSGHVTEDLEYEWKSGMYNGVGKGVRWTALKIEQEVYVDDPPNEIKSRFPFHVGDKNTYMGKVACYVHALGHSYKSYALDPDGTELPDEGMMEPDPAPEEDTGSGDDPRPEPGTEEAIPRYDEVVRQVWEARQHLEYEGTIDVYRCRHAIRPGCKVRVLHADQGVWETMDATVQTVTVEPETGDVSVEVGPASHIALQTAAERARAMSGRVNRAKSATEELANELNVQYGRPGDASETPGTSDTPGTGEGSNTVTYPPRQRPTAPEVGPCFRLMDVMSGQVDLVAEFSVRAIWDQEGKAVVGSEWYGGMVYGPRDTKEVGQQNAWNKGGPALGKLYCNIEVDKEGKITSAEVSSSPVAADEGKIYAPGKLGIDGGEAWRPSAEGWEGTPAKVAILIATVQKDGVIHHKLGSICVPVMPWYVMMQIQDINGEEKEQNPADELAGSQTPPVSLIGKQDDDHKYVKMRQLQAGRGIKLRLGDSGKDGYGTIKVIGEKYKFVDHDYDPSATPSTEPEQPSTGGPVGNPDHPGISILSKKVDTEYDGSDTKVKEVYFRKIKVGQNATIPGADGQPYVLQIRVEDDTLIFDFPVGTQAPGV